MKHRSIRMLALGAVLALLLAACPIVATAAGGDRTIYRRSAPTVDGTLADGEWGAPTLSLRNYQMATLPGGAKKVPLDGEVYMGYDDTHFYLALVARYDEHKNEYTEYDLWRGDALQIQLSADGSDRRSFCFGLGDDGVSRGYQSGDHRETYSYTAPGGEFFVTRDAASATTVYEIALPLSRFSDTVKSLRDKGTLRFSFALHMNNGYYYEWCGGIAQEKSLQKAATLTLGGEAPAPSEPETPTQPDPVLIARIGDVNDDGDITTTDARLILQYAAELEELSNLNAVAADVSGEGDITTTDARQILQYLAELLDAFDAGDYIWETPEVPTPEPDRTDEFGHVISHNTFSPNSAQAGTPFGSLDELRDLKPAGNSFGYFALTTEANEGLPFNVRCHIEGDMVTAMLPAGVDTTALIPTFTYAGSVTANDAPLTSDATALDMSRDVALTLTAQGGETRTLTLRVETLDTGLPSIAMTTEAYQEIVSKEEYLNSTLYLGGGDMEVAELLAATVKGRGNSSWREPKKGYTIKLNEKARLLGMSKSKDWTLIANYEDMTLLRNTMAQYLAEGAGIDFVMKNRSVDLWYNGEYWGTYTLTEKVEIEKDRVNITKYEAGCEPGQTGFLLEFDAHVDEVPDEQKAGWERPLGPDVRMYYDPVTDEVFMPVSYKWVTIKKPSYKNLKEDTRQLRFIYDEVNKAMDALYSGDYGRISQLIDVRSFVRWYLVEEYMNNGDSSFHSSCYMTLDVGGKFAMGPVWDFDRSSRNCDYWNPNEEFDLYNSTAAWFHLLFRTGEARGVLKQEYANFRKTLATLPDYLEEMADTIYASQQYNFERWDILETVVDDTIDQEPNRITEYQQNSQTFEAEIDVLEDYFVDRTAQMDAFIGSL